MPTEAHPEASLPVSESVRLPEEQFFPSPRQLFFLLLAYFTLQVILRTVFSTSVDLDESEQVVWSQKLSLGYGSAPPFYTWLQLPFFAVFGRSVLGLSVLKNLLLLSIYLLTYASARRMTGRAMAGVAAALSVFYLPGTAWEAQRDLTHSTLAAALSAATLLAFLCLHEQRCVSRYLLFGVCAGLGFISKYNYILWLVGLVLAAISLAPWRATVLDRRMLLALAVCLLLFLPNGLWIVTHPDLAFLTSSKFEVKQSIGWLPAVGLGLKHIAQSLTSFAVPLALIYCAVFYVAPVRAGVASGSAGRTLLLRSWVIISMILVLLVCVARATGFKERWFQPILIALPVLAVTLVEQRLTAARLKSIAALSLLVMLAVAVVMPGRLFLAESLCREEPLTRPYAILAAQMRPAVPPGSLVLCDSRLLAGNLRLGLPSVCAISPELIPLFRDDQPHAFLVWDATQSAGPPQDLQAATASLGIKPSGAPQKRFFTATYRYHKHKQYRLGLVQIY